MNNLHLIVRDQFPEFVREDYPTFVAFVEAYYKWLNEPEQNPGSVDTIADLDKTPERFVEFFRNSLDSTGLFNAAAPFNNLYLQKIKQIYNAKGSEQALVNVLKYAYHANSAITYPGEQILRASDGRWNQENFITVKLKTGILPIDSQSFYINYDYNDLRVSLKRIEIIDDRTYRLYYNPRADILASVGLTVSFTNVNTGVVVCTCSVVSSPSNISVSRGGEAWQLGQVIIIPGTKKDTVARVSQISATGEIQRVEILEYGYDHTEFQTIVVSPYPYKPTNSTYDIVSEELTVNPSTFHYTLTLNDYTYGTTDRIVGSVSGVSFNSYFLEDYVQLSYNGATLFDISTSVVNIDDNGFEESGITLEQWLASRATLTYRFNSQTATKGSWNNESGQLSNERIRIQDDFYYQQFSYDVEADVNSSKYVSLAKDIHPAGMKLFTTYGLTKEITIVPEATTTYPFLRLFANDVSTIDDANGKYAVKPRVDELTTSEFNTKHVGKPRVDEIVLGDVNAANIIKPRTDYIELSESRVLELNKYPLDSVGATDTILTLSVNKYFTETASVTSPDTFNLITIKYNEEGYFAENYVLTEHTLNLGA